MRDAGDSSSSSGGDTITQRAPEDARIDVRRQTHVDGGGSGAAVAAVDNERAPPLLSLSPSDNAGPGQRMRG